MKVSGTNMGIRKPRIEMLPLIDIVFLLLVFFIYAMLSMAVHRSMPLSLPVSSTAAINKESHLTVSVRQDGHIYFEHTGVTPAELQTILHDRVLKANGGKSVQVDLFADKAISYQELYRILDLIRTAGIANVTLQAGTIK